LLYIYIYLNYFKKYKNFTKYSYFLNFNKNSFNLNNKIHFFTNNYIFPKSNFKNIVGLISSLFSLKINILFLDELYNYNYLPVNNNFIQKKKKKFYKFLKFFKIGAFIFLNLSCSMIKNFYKYNLINITTHNCLKQDDIFFKLQNIKIFHYILYIITISIYFKKM